MNTFTAITPNGSTLTRKSTQALTHVVIAINDTDTARYFKTWRALAWEASEARALKVAANKQRNDAFGDYTRVEVVPCTEVPQEPKTAAATTTCQLCGRPIKLRDGNIAHHGYKRPSVGFQTSSCRGARHLPYEQACDVLQPEIDIASNWIAVRGAYLKTIEATPPAQVYRDVYKGSGKTERLSIDRPDGFKASEGDRYNAHTYGYWYRHKLREVNRDIDAAEKTRAYLVERLTNWKAPQPPQAG